MMVGDLLINDVTIIIKTFERKACLDRLLKSINDMGLHCSVLVADDSEEPYKNDILVKYSDIVTEYLLLPFDSGVSAGRNELLRRVKTPYFVLCDDDFILDYRTNIEYMINLLESSELDVLGGLYFDIYPLGLSNIISYLSSILLRRKTGVQRTVSLSLFERLRNRKTGVPRRVSGNFEKLDDENWKMTSIEYTPPVTKCDYVLGFFVARTEAVKQKVGGWDESIKIGGEHETLFLKGKSTGLRVGYTEEVGVVHYPETNHRYRNFRSRGYAFMPTKFK